MLTASFLSSPLSSPTGTRKKHPLDSLSEASPRQGGAPFCRERQGGAIINGCKQLPKKELFHLSVGEN
jgi:hypothetical protein